jgi:hypothetical protein
MTAILRRWRRCTRWAQVCARWPRPLIARGGQGDTLAGAGVVSGRGRVDLRFAEDSGGELYILTKSDGMIRQVMGFK